MQLPYPLQDRFYRYNYFLRKKFGAKVYKITVDAGFTCPTRDGTLGTNGCLYCNNLSFSTDRREGLMPVEEQVGRAIEILKRKKKVEKFLVYFQSYTNTYASVSELEKIYSKALTFKDVVGICIGTRPDCIDDDILTMLSNVNKDYFVSIEYGVESVYNKNLLWANRGHDFKTSIIAIEKTYKYGLDIAIHIIFGFPDESNEDVLNSAKVINRLPINSIKIHNLHVVKCTPLENYYKKKPFKLYSEEEWILLMADFLELLRPDIVIQRLIGEAKNNTLVAPRWKMPKQKIVAEIKKILESRETFQGYKYMERKEKLEVLEDVKDKKL
ncbi:MAG: TIGR01212 family radical SAM protein [Candidatus Marinimicrobia bacterium]|nr:TIGR01212 family radical SAM protein [Candidatus Neomarinimicrobiota bacterium]